MAQAASFKDTQTPSLLGNKCACFCPQRKRVPMGLGWSDIADSVTKHWAVEHSSSNYTNRNEEMHHLAAKSLELWFSNGGSSAPGGHWTMSGGISSCYNGGWGWEVLLASSGQRPRCGRTSCNAQDSTPCPITEGQQCRGQATGLGEHIPVFG